MKAKTSVTTAAIVLALAATALLSNRLFRASTVTLSDGAQISVRQVSFGKRHRFIDGPPWQQMLGAMPTNITAPLGLRILTELTAEETLVVWFEWQNGTNKAPSQLYLRVVDSNGLASDSSRLARNIVHSNDTLLAFHLTSFPRREPTVLLELCDLHPPSRPRGPLVLVHLADFRIKNPGFTKEPPAKTQSWPETAQVHGEQFTLLAINTGLCATGALANNSLSNQWTELLFRIGTNEPAQRTMDPNDRGDWAVKSIELRDLFGNFVERREPQGRVFPMGDRYGMRTDDGIALLRGAIWPNDPWNVRAEFERPLDAAHRWTNSIHVPAAVEKISLEKSGWIEGCEIQVRSIEKIGTSPPILLFRFLGKDPGYQARVLGVEDQRGTNIVYRYRGSTGREQRIELSTAPESTDLQIVFGILHSVVVELSGRPSILRDNVARWARE